jgi:glycosyltransferase involved in cell wall biosynthesis
VRPRVLFVARGNTTLPLPPWLAKRWDALSEVFEVRVLNAGTGSGDPRFRLLPLSAWRFYPQLPFAIASELRQCRPDAVVATDPYVALAGLAGRKLARVDTKVICEVHGDPHSFTRLYGSPVRRIFSPLADAFARRGIADADATRAVSTFTASIIEDVRGEPPTASFVAYSDLSAFAGKPPVPVPDAQRIVFVGALERYKNIDGLADAWRRVAAAHPQAVLSIVGEGSRREVVERLVADLHGQVEHRPRLSPAEVAEQLDESRALVLPSYPEGLGRVVLESFARGRLVIGTNRGGIPEIVTDEVDGLLIPRADTTALVAALERVLTDRELCVRLGAAAREAYGGWHQTPEDFSRAYREFVDKVIA